MGMGPGSIQLLLEFWRQGLFKGIDSVVEMGAQDLQIKPADLEELTLAAGLTGYKPEDFANLAHWPGEPRCSTKPFYELLGMKTYSSVDLLDRHGCIRLDLNYPLEDESLYGKFGLVTDYGTNEHVFNTAEAYRTMHRLCAPGGFLLIDQCVHRSNGFFVFDKSFFECMAAANGYRIVFSSYCVSIPGTTGRGSPQQFNVPLADDVLETLAPARLADVSMCYLMQKQSAEDFRYAYQGHTSETGNCGYKLQYLSNPPSRCYVPIFSLESLPGRALLVEVANRIRKRVRSRWLRK